MLLAQKNIVLTGASGGLGAALAHRLAAQNARLLLVGRNGAALEKLRQQLPNVDLHSVCVADISAADGRATITEACRQLPGGLHILVNNAGVSQFGFIAQQTEKCIAQQLSTNLLSPILLCKSLIPLLARQSQAAIVNIGSSFGSIGFPGFASYCASKFGLRGFSEALRREMADTGVQVSYIAPRATRTKINSAQVISMNKKLGNKMDEPDLVAQIVVHAMQHRSGRDTYIGWPEKIFVRLNALWPGLVDGNLRRQLPTIRHFAKL